MAEYQLAMSFDRGGFERGLGLLEIAADHAGLRVLIASLTRLLESEETHVHVQPSAYIGENPDEQVGLLTVSLSGD